MSQEGTIPAYSDFTKSGPAHAKVYWELISSEKPKGWDYRLRFELFHPAILTDESNRFTIDGKEWNKAN